MKSLSKWVFAALTTTLIAGSASAANAIAVGKVKSIDGEKQSFVLTDSANKDFTIKLADDVLVNRDGKESKSDLKPGDPVSVCYDKGVVNWTAHYILVREGKAAGTVLIHGSVKSYDPKKKEIAFTDENDKTLTYAVGDAKIRINREDTKVDELKIGDEVLFAVDTTPEQHALKCVMVHRKK